MGDTLAARILLDRLFGKAPAAITLDGDVNVTHDLDVRAIRDELLHDANYLNFVRSEALRADAKGRG